jgi:hypothetical protein
MSASKYPLIAMKDAGVPLEAVCIDRKYVVFGNGLKLKIRLFNDHNEPVDDPEDATYYEFGNDKIGFGSAFFELDEFREWEH